MQAPFLDVIVTSFGQENRTKPDSNIDNSFGRSDEVDQGYVKKKEAKYEASIE